MLSAFRWRGGDRDVAGFRLVAQARGPLIVPLIAVVLVAMAVFVALVAVALLEAPALVALRVLLRGLPGWLTLLLRLVHGVQDTEVMFRMLEEGFGGHPVSTAGRVAAELEVFLEKLLGGAADTDFRPITVENMVAIERDSAARIMADSAAAA